MFRYASITVLLTAVVLAGCGSSKSPSGDPSTASGSLQSASIKFSNCIRSHGVPNFPDLTEKNGGFQIQQSARAGSGSSMTVDGVPVNGPAFQSAMKDCQSLLPKPKALPGGITEVKASALKFAECMRSDGVPNFPDPKVQSGPGGGIGIQIGGTGVDPQSPAFKAAQAKCQPLLGGAGGKLPTGPGQSQAAQGPVG